MSLQIQSLPSVSLIVSGSLDVRFAKLEDLKQSVKIKLWRFQCFRGAEPIWCRAAFLSSGAGVTSGSTLLRNHIYVSCP